MAAFDVDHECHKIFEAWKFKSKSPGAMAKEIKKKLVTTFGLKERNVFVWSPDEAEMKGYGRLWMVASEEAPYRWPMTLTGWCESIYSNGTVFVECQNHWSVCISKR